MYLSSNSSRSGFVYWFSAEFKQNSRMEWKWKNSRMWMNLLRIIVIKKSSIRTLSRPNLELWIFSLNFILWNLGILPTRKHTRGIKCVFGWSQQLMVKILEQHKMFESNIRSDCVCGCVNWPCQVGHAMAAMIHNMHNTQKTNRTIRWFA